MFKTSLIIFFIIIFTTFCVAEDKNISFEPWGWKVKENEESKRIPGTSTKIVFSKAIRLFSKYVSPLDGPRCRFRPTCARYGLEAVQKYGVFKGQILTAARLLRCHSWIREDTYLLLGDGYFHDPVK